LTRFDFNLFVVLAALHRTGSVSGAARLLGRTQPAVSMALTRLRAHFGDALYVRGSSRGMVATPLGARLGEQALAIVELAQGSFAAERAFDPAHDEFVLALSDIGELVFLPRIVEALATIAPQVNVRSVTPSPQDTERGLEDGRIDLAVGYFPDLKAGPCQQRLFNHYLVCLARADHPLVGSPFTREQFMACSHAVVQSNSRSHELFERFLARNRITRRVALRMPHFTSLPFVIARSDLIATVPHALGIAYARNVPNLKVMRPPFELPDIVLRQYWHQRFHDNERSRWLRRLVAELFNDFADEWTGALDGGAKRRINSKAAKAGPARGA
jgi:DNA-binding transcriptional LysR family regulator